MKDYLTTKEAAEYVRTAPRTLERWRAIGISPPYVKIGRKILYDKHDLIEWLNRHKPT